jgi:hypothetical protein
MQPDRAVLQFLVVNSSRQRNGNSWVLAVVYIKMLMFGVVTPCGPITGY